MNSPFPYQIFPLGDTAFTVDYGNIIDEAINNEVIARFQELQQHPLPGMIEAVPAYSSITVYYNIIAVRKLSGDKTAYQWIKEEMEKRLQQPALSAAIEERLVKIPVCYEKEFAPDIEALAKAKGLTVDEVIHIHSSTTYKVYMLGFLPGFPYMGLVDERIAMPRKPQPVNVAAGSVGIAGRQTGIYPFNSPGGWQIIGRTAPPASLAPQNPPGGGTLEPQSITFLKAGDRVQFYAVSKEECLMIAKQ